MCRRWLSINFRIPYTEHAVFEVGDLFFVDNGIFIFLFVDLAHDGSFVIFRQQIVLVVQDFFLGLVFIHSKLIA